MFEIILHRQDLQSSSKDRKNKEGRTTRKKEDRREEQHEGDERQNQPSNSTYFIEQGQHKEWKQRKTHRFE